MTGEVSLATSSAADQDFTCPSRPKGGLSCRWGDYAGATPDQCNPQLVWGTNQLSGSASGTSPRWTTQNFALVAGAGPVVDPVACLNVSANPTFTNKVVNFDASGSTGPITKYEWDLDGTGTFTTDTSPVNHTTQIYSQPGTFTVRLRVTNGGTTYTTTKSLTVKSGTPTAGFAVPATVDRGQSVTFDASASTDVEALGGIESYSWDFDGDGVTDQTTAGPVVTHTYTTLGTFKARLVVTDADDHQQSAAAVHAVTVQNVAPIAQIAFSPAAPQTGQQVLFSALGATDPDGTIVDYRWDLNGDGTFETDTGSRPEVSRSYSTAGTFPVAVQVQDNDGATAIASSSVSVAAAPVAPVPTAPLKLTLRLSPKARLATVLKRGLVGSVSCRRACVVRLTLRITTKTARQLKTRPVIGTATVSIHGSAAKAVRIRLTRGARKQLRSARSFAVVVNGVATASGQKSAPASATVQVRR
jgi:PKD repeat protein